MLPRTQVSREGGEGRDDNDVRDDECACSTRALGERRVRFSFLRRLRETLRAVEGRDYTASGSDWNLSVSSAKAFCASNQRASLAMSSIVVCVLLQMT